MINKRHFWGPDDSLKRHLGMCLQFLYNRIIAAHQPLWIFFIIRPHVYSWIWKLFILLFSYSYSINTIITNKVRLLLSVTKEAGFITKSIGCGFQEFPTWSLLSKQTHTREDLTTVLILALLKWSRGWVFVNLYCSSGYAHSPLYVICYFFV